MARSSQAVKGRKRQARSVWKERAQKLMASGLLRKLAVIGMLVAGWQLLHASLRELDVLPIENVYIEGEFKYLSHDELQQQARPYVNGGFFTVDLANLREQLMRMPWVEDVSIRRQWPDSLLLRVIEKQPVAYWGKTQLLSSRAVLFQPKVLDKDMSIPQIIGPENQHRAMLKELGKLQSWLSDTGLQISILQQDARRSWTLTMESGLELRLGREMQHERIQRFADAYQRSLKQKQQQIRHVDMRYTNGFAVAWKQGKHGRGV